MAKTKALFQFGFTKTETQADGSLLVAGTATSEAIDSQGDVMDYGASVAAFDKFAGNVREMHQPKAVGRAVKVTKNEETKSIEVEALISSGAADTIQLVKDGVLRGFSVGGEILATKAEKRDGVDVRRVTAWKCHELSLVDVGANPDSNNVAIIAKLADALDPEITRMPKLNLSAVETPIHDRYKRLTQKTPKEPTRKYAGTWDLRCALDTLEELRMLRSSELYEVTQGEEMPADAAAQVAKIDAAISAIEAFIGMEANELAPEMDSSEELAAGVGLGLRSMRAMLTKTINSAAGAAFSKTDSEEMTSALVARFESDSTTIQEAVTLAKAENLRELKVVREEIAKLANRLEQIAASPILVGAPVVKNLPGLKPTQEVPAVELRKRELRQLINRAPRIDARTFLENELAALNASL